MKNAEEPTVEVLENAAEEAAINPQTGEEISFAEFLNRKANDLIDDN